MYVTPWCTDVVPFVAGDALDETKWSVSFPGWHGTPPAAFDASSVIWDNDGMVNLQTINVEGTDYVHPPPDDTCSCAYEAFTSGVLYSVATVEHGYFEVRARTANVDGLQSSFFLQGLSTITTTSM